MTRRGCGLAEYGSAKADFGDDLLGGFVPDEGFGVVVPVPVQVSIASISEATEVNKPRRRRVR